MYINIQRHDSDRSRIGNLKSDISKMLYDTVHLTVFSAKTLVAPVCYFGLSLIHSEHFCRPKLHLEQPFLA